MEKIVSPEKDIQPAALRTLEETKDFFPKDKMLLLAVVLGVKPASLITTDLFSPSEIPALRKRVENCFTSFDLVYREEGIDYQNEPFISLQYAVAKDNTALDQVKDALSQPLASDAYHELLGKVVGIPNSAIDGFLKNEKLSRKEIKDNFSEEEKAFRFFSPSKEGLESEKEFLRMLAAKIREVSSTIYAEIISPSQRLNSKDDTTDETIKKR